MRSSLARKAIPFFAEELIAAADEPRQRAPDWPARPAAAGAWPASTVGRRACCAWPRPPAATSATRCCAPSRSSPSVTCVNLCARRWSTASWRPIRLAAASASATRSWLRRSTRRSSQVSARSCTLDSPTSSPAVERRHQRSSRPTGRRPVDQAKRSSPPSRRRARQTPSSASPRRSPTSSGRSHCGTRCLTRASSPGSITPTSAHGLPSSPAEQAPPRTRSSSPSRQSTSSTRATRCARHSCTSGSAVTCSRAVAATSSSPPCERAVEIVPAHPPSADRARALAALGSGLRVVWRFDESRAVCEQALELARMVVGANDVEVRVLTTLGSNLCLSRSRRGGPRPAQPGPRGRPADWRPGCAATGLHLAHRRADDARTATRVRPDRRSRDLRDAPLRDGPHRPGRELDRGAPRDRRMGPRG